MSESASKYPCKMKYRKGGSLTRMQEFNMDPSNNKKSRFDGYD